ncbi:Anaerobic regulatory protein [compost metagenome]
MSQAIALEDTRLCRINLGALRALASNLPSLHHNILRLLTSEVQHDHSMLTTLGVMSAEERVISFLLDLSARLAARGFAATEFQLRMTREEIGSYLGLKLETISRLFSRLAEAGLVRIKHRSVKLLDMASLRAMLERATALPPVREQHCRIDRLP